MSTLSVGKLQGLPVNSNVMTVPSGHTLYAPGHVIQVVQTTYSTAVQTNSSTFVDVTGLSATITPKFASSKILVVVAANHRPIGTSNYANTEHKLLRGSTDLAFQQWEGQGANGMGGGFGYTAALAFNYLDSPNTTSPTTYKIQTRLNSGLWSIFHTGNSYSSTTLMEIAA